MDPSLCALIVGVVFAAVGVTSHIAAKDREQRYAELKKVVPIDAGGMRPHEGKIVALRGIPQLMDCAPLVTPYSLVPLIKYKTDRYTREIVYNPALKAMDERIMHLGSEHFDVPFRINGVFICELPNKIKYRDLHETIVPLSGGYVFNNGKILDVICKFSGVQATTKLTAIGKIVKDSLLDDFSLVSAGIVSCMSDKTLDEQIAEVAPHVLDYVHIGAYAVAFGVLAFVIGSGKRR